jgi:hypothetical protein
MPQNLELTHLSRWHFGLGMLIFLAFPLLFGLSQYFLPGGALGSLFFFIGFLLLFIFCVLLMASSVAINARKVRIFSLVCGVLSLPFFPIGTGVGIYTLLLLTRSEVVAEYASGRRQWGG